jgi:hypothetical protein
MAITDYASPLTFKILALPTAKPNRCYLNQPTTVIPNYQYPNGEPNDKPTAKVTPTEK